MRIEGCVVNIKRGVVNIKGGVVKIEGLGEKGNVFVTLQQSSLHCSNVACSSHGGGRRR